MNWHGLTVTIFASGGGNLVQFNQAQEKAIDHFKGPCMVLAGPGSGKTAVITHRVKNLIEKYQVPSRNILVITFTKAAAMEMKERFMNLMGGKNLPVWFGTFHGIFFTILKHAYGYNGNNILKDNQKKQFLLEIIERIDIEIEDENDFMSDLESEISYVKGEMIELSGYYSMNCAKDVFTHIYEEYNKQLRKHNVIDFDDMLIYCYELFSQRKDILAQWQKQFSYILIDEFQDINRVQYEIVKMLAQPEDNLFIVGDDDQSIYGFRGAKPELMLGFEQVYPNAKRIMLDVNYRSCSCIVETAGKVIVNNKRRFSKNISAARERGDVVQIVEFENLDQENKKIIEQIQKKREEGIPLEEMAVLFRTKTQPRALVGKLMEYNIPFSMKEMLPNIFHHWIARDIISYIKIGMGHREREYFLRVYNRPKRYIHRSVFDTPMVDFEMLYTYYEDKSWMIERIDQFEYDIVQIEKMTPYAAITYIRKGIGYEEYLKEYADSRRIKVEDLLETLEEIHESSRKFSTFEEWFSYIEEFEKELEEQKKNRLDKEQEGIALMTMHGSKGLEFQVVFIIDVNEEMIPHKKAVVEEDIEEERRMFYVGMTRAKQYLYLYFVKERYNKEMFMSRFIEEIVEE